VRKDGTLIDVAVTISPVRDEHGRVVGASKIARDITEREQIEDETRQHANLLSLAPALAKDLDRRICGRAARSGYMGTHRRKPSVESRMSC
jgi:PAS fold